MSILKSNKCFKRSKNNTWYLQKEPANHHLYCDSFNRLLKGTCKRKWLGCSVSIRADRLSLSSVSRKLRIIKSMSIQVCVKKIKPVIYRHWVSTSRWVRCAIFYLKVSPSITQIFEYRIIIWFFIWI